MEDYLLEKKNQQKIVKLLICNKMYRLFEKGKRLSKLTLLLFTCIITSLVSVTNSNQITMGYTNGIQAKAINYNKVSLASGSQDVDHNRDVKSPIPIIGILTQVFRDYKRITKDRHFHMSASYVKWIESAGAQVLPILLNQDDSYYERVFRQTNGLLFPGGDNLLDPNKNTPMMYAAKKLYKMAVDANNQGNYYPIWGTCLGLELLSVLSSNKNVLENCLANDMSLTMDFRDRGRMFAPTSFNGLIEVDYSKAIIEALKTKNLTYNHHHFCLTLRGLKEANLDKFYKPLAFSKDKSGIEFIAAFEALNYPFFAVQFHPEKPPFEFIVKKSQKNMPHSRDAIAVSRYFADFFVTSAQLNAHKPPNERAFLEGLIYAQTPTYTAIDGDMYEQRYMFPYQHKDGISDEEFLDYVLDSDEEVHEEVVSIPSASLEKQAPQNSIELLLDYELVDNIDPVASPGLAYKAEYPETSQEEPEDEN